jgi:hypothetical protein
VTAYFDAYEQVVDSLDALAERVQQAEALSEKTSLRFYWRGQAKAGWGVHSSLHRAIAKRDGSDIADVSEETVTSTEKTIVAEARDWIRPAVGARLTTVDVLARLQHAGAPTRLLDFTSDPHIAAYFAVADRPHVDGRLVVAAARSELTDAIRNAFDVPWARGHAAKPQRWFAEVYALEDHADFLRITRQKGVFLGGGTPSTQPQRLLEGNRLLAGQVRASLSIPLVLHQWSQAEAAATGAAVGGREPTVASALTLRIPAAAKGAMRAGLEAAGLSHAHLFPDEAGLIRHAPSLAGLVDR